MRSVTFVTGNPGKLKELSAVLTGVVNLTSKDVDLLEIQGTAEEISREKCKLAVEAVKGPVLVEDTCLEFDALGGMPGPYVKWFLKQVGAKGLHDMLVAFPNKKAKAICTMSYCDGESSDIHVFQGVVEGEIVEPRGDGGFGWDGIFKPSGYDKTYAELDSKVKCSISHRTLATNKLLDFFNESANKKQKN